MVFHLVLNKSQQSACKTLVDWQVSLLWPLTSELIQAFSFLITK